MENKPITYVATYRGVQGFPIGRHLGKHRDVIVAGAMIPSARYTNGYNFVPADMAQNIMDSAQQEMTGILENIDAVYAYLGARGMGAGFNYLQNVMQKNNSTNIKVVACDCNAYDKEEFCRHHNVPIIWSECGGKQTLGKIVHEILSGYNKA